MGRFYVPDITYLERGLRIEAELATRPFHAGALTTHRVDCLSSRPPNNNKRRIHSLQISGTGFEKKRIS